MTPNLLPRERRLDGKSARNKRQLVRWFLADSDVLPALERAETCRYRETESFQHLRFGRVQRIDGGGIDWLTVDIKHRTVTGTVPTHLEAIPV